jgi:nucleotide-binding universal stress UspA family protein
MENNPFRKILVYIDGSENSITAMQFAVCLCRLLGADLTALYVVNTRAIKDLLKARIFIEAEEEEYQHDLEADAERYLNHARDLARSKGLAIETVRLSGSVHQEIKHYVTEHDIDLLVMGEIEHVRRRRDEMYSEAEMALQRVGCSVLTVKDEERVWTLFDTLA